MSSSSAETQMTIMQELEELLRAAGDTLVSCPTLRRANSLSDEELHHLLIQRRFVSLAFTPFYDAIIDALDDPETIVVCRQVLREEYPDHAGNTPSHRELLVTDLVALGVDKTKLRTARPTPATAQAIIASFELVPVASLEACSTIAVAATAACYSESLVAAEYRALEPRLDRQFAKADSVFYGPHLDHDHGHAKRLLEQVRIAMRGDTGYLAVVTAVIDRCLRAKLDFYKQFEHPADA